MGCETCDRRYHYLCGYNRGCTFVHTSTTAKSYCWDCKDNNGAAGLDNDVRRRSHSAPSLRDDDGMGPAAIVQGAANIPPATAIAENTAKAIGHGDIGHRDLAAAVQHASIFGENSGNQNSDGTVRREEKKMRLSNMI